MALRVARTGAFRSEHEFRAQIRVRARHLGPQLRIIAARPYRAHLQGTFFDGLARGAHGRVQIGTRVSSADSGARSTPWTTAADNRGAPRSSAPAGNVL